MTFSKVAAEMIFPDSDAEPVVDDLEREEQERSKKRRLKAILATIAGAAAIGAGGYAAHKSGLLDTIGESMDPGWSLPSGTGGAGVALGASSVAAGGLRRALPERFAGKIRGPLARLFMGRDFASSQDLLDIDSRLSGEKGADKGVNWSHRAPEAEIARYAKNNPESYRNLTNRFREFIADHRAPDNLSLDKWRKELAKGVSQLEQYHRKNPQIAELQGRVSELGKEINDKLAPASAKSEYTRLRGELGVLRGQAQMPSGRAAKLVGESLGDVQGAKDYLTALDSASKNRRRISGAGLGGAAARIGLPYMAGSTWDLFTK